MVRRQEGEFFGSRRCRSLDVLKALLCDFVAGVGEGFGSLANSATALGQMVQEVVGRSIDLSGERTCARVPFIRLVDRREERTIVTPVAAKFDHVVRAQCNNTVAFDP